MIIFCDVDGVVCDFAKQYVRYYNEEFGTNVDYKAIKDWDVPGYLGLKKDSFRYLRDPYFYADIDAIADSIESLNRINEAGIKIYFTSTCVTKESLVGKIDFLARNFKWFNMMDFVSIHYKKFICPEEDVCMFIEDHPKKSLDMQLPVIVYAHPYNEHLSGRVALYTDKWSEIEGYVIRVKEDSEKIVRRAYG